ncbi:MAG: class I SAM-dependent methyltransferase [Clostridia bacterium]|nr:class I SAM-dependent methyltransferase [Clostridia bacterium]
MEISAVDNGQAFDFGKTSAAYARYRDIYPAALYERLKAFGVAADGTAWLDLGTGTGVLPKNLYNPNAKITGADISAEQIAYAKREAAANGMDVTYLVAPAERTGLPSGSFDAITAAQCFFYFDRDAMQKELRRLIKPGGVFIKIFMDWTADDPIAAESSRIVRSLNPGWRSSEAAKRDMADALFPDMQTESFFADLPFSPGSWHGRMRACRGTLASMDAETFKKWEAAHLAMLSRCPPDFTVRHVVSLAAFRL